MSKSFNQRGVPIPVTTGKKIDVLLTQLNMFIEMYNGSNAKGITIKQIENKASEVQDKIKELIKLEDDIDSNIEKLKKKSETKSKNVSFHTNVKYVYRKTKKNQTPVPKIEIGGSKSKSRKNYKKRY